jgi:hypothetical protein
MPYLKVVLMTLGLICLAVHLNAQKAMSVKEGKKQGISLSDLDESYQNAIHSDSSKALFKNTSDFHQEWKVFLTDVKDYIRENDFKWEQNLRLFNKVYFAKDGSIDYYFYLIRSSHLTKEQKQRFKELLNEFISDYKFPLTADVNFTQCGSSILVAEKE